MKVYEKMLGDKIENLKDRLIDEIMAGVIKITYPDGTVEKQEPCPLFWEHIKSLIGRDKVIDEVCAEIEDCNVRECWEKYFELEVNK